jgi:hypothetical protein
MDPVKTLTKFSSDIAKLEQGVDRVNLALEALTNSKLTADKLNQLGALLQRAALLKSDYAIAGQVSLDGERFDTLLSKSSFSTTHFNEIGVEQKDGYRLATRAEQLAYVDRLIGRELDGSATVAELNALGVYRERVVRDNRGGIGVEGQSIVTYGWLRDGRHGGELLVRRNKGDATS